MSGPEAAARVVEAMREVGAGWAILTSPGAVAYATGFAPALGAAASPFSGGPATAILVADGSRALVLPDIEAEQIEGVATIAYKSFHGPPDDRLTERWAEAVLAAAVRLGARGAVATERRSLPAALAERLPDQVDLSAALAAQRATKTAAEVAALRRSAALTETGQAAAAAALRPGITELEIFSALRTAMESELGGPFELELDLLSGPRTADLLGPPTARAVAYGDAVLIDLVPRVGAYWGDSCATLVAGAASEAQLALHRTAVAALELAEASIRPGLPVAELDAIVRDGIESNGYEAPIHAGHGIGADNVEPPRILPGAPGELREDMVLMIEPCARERGVGGVRVERMLRVTAHGCESLSTHQLGPAP